VLGVIVACPAIHAAMVDGGGDHGRRRPHVGGLAVAPSWMRARLNEDAQVGAALSD